VETPGLMRLEEIPATCVSEFCPTALGVWVARCGLIDFRKLEQVVVCQLFYFVWGISGLYTYLWSKERCGCWMTQHRSHPGCAHS